MNKTQLELTRLIGKKELSFGCLIKMEDDREIQRVDDGYEFDYDYGELGRVRDLDIHGVIEEIIGHPATLPDFHRFMNEKKLYWTQRKNQLIVSKNSLELPVLLYGTYDSNKDLLDQEEETLKHIVELIKSNQS